MFTSVWLRDTVERAVATFAEAALGVWILAGPGDLFNVDLAEGAAAAGAIAGLAVVKAAIASKIGSGTNASLDPTLVTAEVVTPPSANGSSGVMSPPTGA
jgi:Putative lactococcus lactis phage r1t holin